MEEIVERIKIIMEKEGFSSAEFADRLTVGRPLLSHVLGGRNNPSLQLLMKITEHFPAYNIDWIVHGKESTQLPEGSIATKKDEPNLASIQQNESMQTIHPENKNEPVHKSEVIRTLLFFKDGTFEEYKPRE